MPAAGVALAVVAVAALVALAVVLVVGAGGVRVIGQRAGQQRFGLCVRRAARAGASPAGAGPINCIIHLLTVK